MIEVAAHGREPGQDRHARAFDEGIAALPHRGGGRPRDPRRPRVVAGARLAGGEQVEGAGLGNRVRKLPRDPDRLLGVIERPASVPVGHRHQVRQVLPSRSFLATQPGFLEQRLRLGHQVQRLLLEAGLRGLHPLSVVGAGEIRGPEAPAIRFRGSEVAGRFRSRRFALDPFLHPLDDRGEVDPQAGSGHETPLGKGELAADPSLGKNGPVENVDEAEVHLDRRSCPLASREIDLGAGAGRSDLRCPAPQSCPGRGHIHPHKQVGLFPTPGGNELGALLCDRGEARSDDLRLFGRQASRLEPEREGALRRLGKWPGWGRVRSRQRWSRR